MNKNIRLFFTTIVMLVLSACAKPAARVPTTAPSPTPPIPTDTPVPIATLTLVPTTTATTLPTLTQTPTYTVTPFPGFGDRFKFYQAWTGDETTFFYFMNAQVDQTIYATVDDLEGNQYPLTCPPDDQYPADIRCYSDTLFKGKADYKVTFYSDPERQYPFFENIFATDLNTRYSVQVFEPNDGIYEVDDAIYYHQNDCPQRGENVQCESEYRLYDGNCYYAHTCYDACGLYYSKDNLPDVFNEFQGFTTPCN